MPRFNPFPARIPSRRVTPRRYPEQWAWWRASGWLIVVADAKDGGLHLRSYLKKQGYGCAIWGADATPEEASTREGVQRFLTEALYMHLHQTKAKRALAATGQACTEKELAAFIRQQRRKMAAKPIMRVAR